MTLQLVRLPIDLAALSRVAGDRGWTPGRGTSFDEGAALHHLLGETFGPAMLQPFRLSVAPRAHRATLYAYTTGEVKGLVELAAATAMPEVVAALAPEQLESKLMPSDWAEGRRLGFDVRLRPTVRLGSDIPPACDGKGAQRQGFKRGAEIDAFLAEALRNSADDAMAKAGRTREKVYRDWLQGRLGEGAELEMARLVSFKRSRSVRRKKVLRGLTTAMHEGPDIVMHGTLRIADAMAFAASLCSGIGRHRAYGFGMLLLRPPSSAR